MLTQLSKHLQEVPTVRSRSQLMELWRRALTNDDVTEPTEAVITELSEYFAISAEEATKRCLNWEADSMNEWKAKDRTTPAGLIDFYQTQTSWIFDTMWYHAEQYYDRKPTESVDIAEGLMTMCPDLIPGHHLDFGAGPGSSSLFFRMLGWDISLADVSTTFLNFAKWRLQRHNASAVFYDTTRDKLPIEKFDLITAFDVMVHVPNSTETIQELHRALKPNGYLIFNIDNQPLSERTASHLYSEQFPILRPIRTIGFRRCPKISYFHVYQKADRNFINRFLIRVTDQLRYNWFISIIGKVARLAGIRRQK